MDNNEMVTLGQVQGWLDIVAFDLRGHSCAVQLYAHTIDRFIRSEQLTDEREERFLRGIRESLDQIWGVINQFYEPHLLSHISDIKIQDREDQKMVEVRHVQDWLGVIAFGMKAPLTRLGLCVELMQEDTEFFSVDERSGFLQNMPRSAEEISEYIESIRDMERFKNFVKNRQ